MICRILRLPRWPTNRLCRIPKSDSIQNEAIPVTVMYVESDVGDSSMVNLCFGDDDVRELHEFDLDTVLIDDSTYGLYETTAETLL